MYLIYLKLLQPTQFNSQVLTTFSLSILLHNQQIIIKLTISSQTWTSINLSHKFNNSNKLLIYLEDSIQILEELPQVLINNNNNSNNSSRIMFSVYWAIVAHNSNNQHLVVQHQIISDLWDNKLRIPSSNSHLVVKDKAKVEIYLLIWMSLQASLKQQTNLSLIHLEVFLQLLRPSSNKPQIKDRIWTI
jgi:hypothetical protein